jgi:hypothetical protein
MDTEPTMTEAEVRQHMGLRDDVEVSWTKHGWAVRQSPEPGVVPITIAYIQEPPGWLMRVDDPKLVSRWAS